MLTKCARSLKKKGETLELTKNPSFVEYIQNILVREQNRTKFTHFDEFETMTQYKGWEMMPIGENLRVGEVAPNVQEVPDDPESIIVKSGPGAICWEDPRDKAWSDIDWYVFTAMQALLPLAGGCPVEHLLDLAQKAKLEENIPDKFYHKDTLFDDISSHYYPDGEAPDTWKDSIST